MSSGRVKKKLQRFHYEDICVTAVKGHPILLGRVMLSSVMGEVHGRLPSSHESTCASKAEGGFLLLVLELYYPAA